MANLSTFILIAIGGSVGACSRFAISEFVALMLGKNFPYGTLLVNIVGSFLMGLLMSAFDSGFFESQAWRQLIGLGFLGALTTFSTFSMDNITLLQQGEVIKMGLNVFLNVFVSILAAWLGFMLLTRN